MRIVLDTNVLIASLISRGKCYALVENSLKVHEIISSKFILDELAEKLQKKFKYEIEDINEALSIFRSKMAIVIPSPLEQQVCRDIDDDWILATALTGKAQCIVTGDKDLLAIARFENIDIIAPVDFQTYEENSLI
ncbi:putative toxin-antitoxin system toxin component, PIN family [Pseudanabaena sp. FACHB-1277]|uniref:Toxin-antitoxin system toxin component, PIN family n=1 Tax=Pseudanabaena cinerea FACHB-1277 TaxID=2949581 RepID=A0A926Z7R1_9CYAN|nr:putative toxin-antitoxin system toxin component, PIN family [Pseudanabaena cinerea]MBD2152361.1 putative toxin-antitoxin system toxin component, PIN family [Pseudanabaena cinerea FACHB-1277]